VLHILLIAAALAIHASASDQWNAPLAQLFTAAGAEPALAAALSLLLASSPLALAWLITHHLCRAAARAIDQQGDHHAPFRASRVSALFRSASCIWLATTALCFGWVKLSGLALAAALPAIPPSIALYLCELLALVLLSLLMAASWWSLAPVERRLREATLLRHLDTGRPLWEIPTRAQFTLARLRDSTLFMLVPIVVLMSLSRALDWLAARILSAAQSGQSWAVWLPAWSLDPDSPITIAAMLQVVGVIAALAFMPLLQRRIWDTVPLATGPLHHAITALCAQSRARIRRILVWRTRGLSVNAAVLGALPRWRYLIFTDALLESMPAPHVQAVAAHEIGHLRHHHVAWLIAGMAGVLLLTSELAARAALAAGLGDGMVELAGLAAAIFLGVPILGVVSRRFEWQADAHAARLLSPPGSPNIDPAAALTVAAALASVASLNGVDPDSLSWRHGSISLRRRRVRALANLPAARLPIDRTARQLKLALLACWLGVLALVLT